MVMYCSEYEQFLSAFSGSTARASLPEAIFGQNSIHLKIYASVYEI